MLEILHPGVEVTDRDSGLRLRDRRTRAQVALSPADGDTLAALRWTDGQLVGLELSDVPLMQRLAAAGLLQDALAPLFPPTEHHPRSRRLFQHQVGLGSLGGRTRDPSPALWWGLVLVLALPLSGLPAFHTWDGAFSGTGAIGGLVLGLAGISACLSLRGLLQFLYAAGVGEGRLVLQHTLGLPHLDVDHRRLYAEPRAHQLGSLAVGLLSTEAVLLAARVTGSTRLASIALLALFVSAAPMLMTDGARALELLGGHRQRLRTGDYLRQGILRALRDRPASDDLTVYLSATAWMLWIAGGLSVLKRHLLPAVFAAQLDLLALEGWRLGLAGAVLLGIGVVGVLGTLRLARVGWGLLMQLRPHTLKAMGDADAVHRELVAEASGPVALDLDGATLHGLGKGRQSVLPTDALWFLTEGVVEVGPARPEGDVERRGHLEAPCFIDLRPLSMDAPVPLEAVARAPARLVRIPLPAVPPDRASDPAPLAALEACAPLDDFSDLLLAALLHGAESRPFAAGDTLLVRGTPGDAMAVLTAGRVRVDADTGPVSLMAGDLVGELGLLYGRPRSADVTALEDGHALWVRREDLMAALRRYPAPLDRLHSLARARGGAA